jgi:hypothetical protein
VSALYSELLRFARNDGKRAHLHSEQCFLLRGYSSASRAPVRMTKAAIGNTCGGLYIITVNLHGFVNKNSGQRYIKIFQHAKYFT